MTRGNERGFTLIEVVMATLLLVVGMGIIGLIVSNVTQKNFYSNRHTQAVTLAQNKIEELINLGYSHDDLAEGDYENSLNPVNSVGDSGGIFYQFWEIDDVDPIERSKKITSIVRWEGTDGEPKSVVLSSVCIDESN